MQLKCAYKNGRANISSCNCIWSVKLKAKMIVFSCDLTLLLVILQVLISNICTMNEMQFDRVELVNSTYYENHFNVTKFRIAKFNRTTYTLNLEMETFTDVDDTHEVDVSFYYNRLNNNQYSKSPMRVPRSTYCSAMGKFRPIIMAAASRNNTNLFNSDESSCPLKKASDSFNSENVRIKINWISFSFFF